MWKFEISVKGSNGVDVGCEKGKGGSQGQSKGQGGSKVDTHPAVQS